MAARGHEVQVAANALLGRVQVAEIAYWLRSFFFVGLKTFCPLFA